MKTLRQALINVLRHARLRVNDILRSGVIIVALSALAIPAEAWAQVCANPGSSGAATPSGIVNVYFQGTTNLAAGATTLTLGARNATGATNNIVVGDLLLIIQMQDGVINSTNTGNYGDGSSGAGTTSVGSAGLHEFVKVLTTTGTGAGAAITFSPALTNNYIQAAASATNGQQRYQVIRVPQYTTATVAGVTAPAWAIDGAATGETGGVAVVDVTGTLTLGSGTVEGQTGRAFFLAGKGFRGGAGIQSTANSPNTDWASPATGAQGGKGEGIAGTPRFLINKTNLWGFQTTNNGTAATQAALTQLDYGVEGYPGGSHARGAPGNAGGGGTDGGTTDNSENAGGGGGGGYGDGGYGGRPWNAPLVDTDGRGGAGYATTLAFNRLFLGGGGGSGGTNNGTSDTGVYINQAISCNGANGICSSGAAGGGIVIIRANQVVGTGVIDVRGAHGYNTGNDAAGGGGGGGSVVIYSIVGGNATVDASGGDGGNAWAGQDVGNPSTTDRHGPGGGGGAGFVAFSPTATSVTAILTGGVPGITTNGNNDYYSSTGNNGGLATFQIPSTPGVIPGALCSPNLQLAKSDGVTTLTSGGNTTYTLTASNTGGIATTGTITVVDVLPTQLTVNGGAAGALTLSGAQAANWTCTAAAKATTTTVTCTSSTVIAASGSSIFAFPAAVVGANGTAVTNKSAIGGGGDTSKTTPTATTVGNCTANNSPAGCALDTDTIVAPFLTLSKTDGTDSVLAGGTTTYTLTVTNSGAAATTGTITVIDVLPTGMTSATFTANNFTCTYTAGTNSFSCVRTVAIAPGASVTIPIPVTISATAPGALTNLAKIGGGGDPSKTTTPTVATTTACPAPVPPATTSFDTTSGCAGDIDSVKHVNLSLSKDDGVPYIVINGTTTYVFTVTNNGDTASVGTINFRDVLPAPFTWPAALTVGGTNSANWTCVRTSGTVATCTSTVAIPLGATSQFSLVANANAATQNTQYINQSRIGGGGDADLLTGALTSANVTACISDNNPAGCAIDMDTATQPTIRLAKSHSDPQARSPGDTVPFTLAVTNYGSPSGGAGTIRVIDILPTGLTFSGTTPFTSGIFSCAVVGQTITCNNTAVLGLTATTFINFNAVLAANAATILVNKAQVGTNGADPTNATFPTTTTAGACTGTDAPTTGCAVDTVASPTNITLNKTAPATVVGGASLTYTIGLGNSGGTTSGTTLTVTDVLPAGVTYVSAAAGTNVTTVVCTGTTTVTCIVTLTAGLAPGAANGAGTFTIVTTAPTTAGSITNYASVDPTGGTTPPTPGAACTPATSCGSATTNVTLARNLGITKTSNGPWTIGQAGATYTLTVTNTGTSATTGTITVKDTLPTGITANWAGTLAINGWSCTFAGQAVTCTRTTALAANTGTITIVLPVNVAAAAYPSVINIASVGGGGDNNNGGTPPTPGSCVAGDNHCASNTTTINVPNLSITKAANSPWAVAQAGTIYTLTVTNTGPVATSGTITVKDLPPTGITAAASFSSGTWTCTTAAQTVTCTSTTSLLATSGTSTISIPVTIAATAAASSVNNASVGGGGDPNNGGAPPTPGTCLVGDNHCGSVTTTISPKADLVVTKVASPVNTYVPGQSLNYTITVTNNGPSDLSGVTVSDLVPASVAVSAWSCSVSSGSADCDTTAAGTGASGSTNTITLPNVFLASGASLSIAVTGTVPLSATGSIINSVTATPPAGTTCTTAPCTKTTTVTNTNGGTPVLSIVKTATPSTFAIGQTGTYSLQVSNTGTTSTAGTITVSDTLPAGITTTATPSGTNWSCGASTTTQVTCTTTTVLLPGGNAPVINVPITVAAGTASSISNTGTVSGGGDASCPLATSHCASTIITGVNAPQITLSKSVQSSLIVGVPNNYLITATNTGQATTLAGTISDIIPTGLTIGTLPGGCSASGQTVTCVLPAGILVGGNVVFTIPITPQASTSGTSVANTAVASGGGDPSCPAALHCDGTTTNTVLAPQLKIVKSASPSTFVVGQPATYTLTVTNTGTAATTAASSISDVIPTGLTIGTLPSGCTASGQTVTCTVPTNLATGTPVAFAIPVIPQNSLNGLSVTNTAGVTGGGDPGCATGTPLASLPARCQSPVTNPVSAPQLTIVKTASTSSFVVGVPASYTLTVTNTGSATTTASASITDVIPGGLTIGTLPSGCTASGQQVTCTFAAGLIAGSNVVFVIPVTPTVAATNTSVSNTASVSGGGDPTCPNTANCTSTIITPVSAPQLKIVKSASASNFVVGVPASYTLQVTNIGTAATTATSTISDNIPSTLTIGTLPAGCSASGQTVTCTIAAPLATGTPVSFVIPVTPLPAASGTTLANTASVVGGGDASCPTNTADCQSTVNTPVNAPAVKVVKTASSPNFVVGVPASYTLTVTNTGSAATTAITTVVDIVPSSLTIGTLPGGCTSSGQTVTCTIAAGLATNVPVTFVIPVTALASANGTSVSNTATISGGGDPTCPNVSNPNCTSTIITPVKSPQLQIVKTASATNFVVGVPASYTLTVTNIGTAATTATSTITDTIPGTLTIGTLPSGCSNSGQTVTCTIAAPLATGTPVSFVIPVTPQAAASGTTLSNTANVIGGGDSSCPANTANCQSTITTPVKAPALQIVKTASTGNFVVGTPASYTLTVTNIGSAATIATSTVSDSVPASLSLGAAPAGCTITGQQVTCTVAAGLAVGASVSFIIPVTPLAIANGTTVNNTATVSGGGDPTCPNVSNPNCTSTTGTPVNAPQLVILKTVSSNPLIVGVPATYTLMVTNSGSAATTATSTVTDTIPSTLTLGTLPSGCSAVGQTVTCTIAAPLAINSPVSFVIPITPQAAASGTSVSNTGSVVGGGDPSCPGGANCTSTTITPVVTKADLVVTKVASPVNTYVPGQSLNYTITVTNNGPSDLSGVTVSDLVPASVAVSAWSCSVSSGSADCDTTAAGTGASGSTNTITLPNVFLASGASLSIAVTGTVPLSATGSIINSVTATPPAGTTCTTAPCTKTTTVTNTNGGTPVLSIVKTATPSTFAIGQTGTYSLQVSNTGTTSTAGTITVSDTLPAGITTTATPSGTNWSCGASTTTQVTCTTTTVLLPGGNAPVINVPITVAAGTASSISNTGTVSGGGDASCPLATSHCASTIITGVNAPQITLSKSVQSSLIVGVPNNYLITATNTGQATTLAGTISDIIPTGLTIGTLPGGCSASGQTVTCVLPAGILVGGNVVFTIPITPQASTSGTSVANTAVASGGGDPSCPAALHCDGTTTNTVLAPQLKIVKSASPSTFVVGQPATYTLTVTNTGTAATTAASSISDVIPTGLTIGTLPSGCTASGQTVTCTVPTNLATGTPVAFAIPVIPQNSLNGLSVTNTAGVTGGGDPGCATGTPLASLPARCQSPVTNPVSAPQLTIVKTASTSSFVVGVPASYTLTVTNTGSATTTASASITDVIPGGLTIGTLPSGCTASGQQVTCTFAAGLIAGSNVVFVIPVTPTVAATNTSVSNTASVSGGGDPTCPNTANCTSTIITPVSAPQLKIVKSASASNFVVGVPASYTLQVTNIGTAATTATSTISDNIPSTLTIGTLPAGCSASGQTVTCTIAAPLATGTPVSFVIPVTPLPAASGTTLANTASVVGGGDASCPTNTADCQSTVNTPVNAPAVKVVKTASSPNFVVGVPASYTLTVTNTGSAATTAITTVVDIVPSSLTIGTLPGGCTSSGQTVTCTIAAGLATNVPVTFVIPVTALASANGTSVSNTATISGGGDPTCPNVSNPNCTSTIITPVKSPQLQIVKTASATNFVVGVPASYTLTVTNIGTAATTATSTITDTIPGTLTIGTLPSGCSNSGQTVTCTIAAPLATGTPVSFVIPVTPQAAASGTTLSNTANVIGGGDSSCPANTANCQSTITTPVKAPALQIVKTASTGNFVVGTPASYTLTVTNIGSAATIATSTVSDSVPASLSLGAAPAGCTITGQQVTCTVAAGLAVGASVSFIIPVTPLAIANGTTVNNTATVSGGGDPTCPNVSNPNCTSTTGTPVNAPQLVILKTVSSNPLIVGVPATYTLMVTNSGSAATTATSTVTDTIPSTLTIGTLPSGCSNSGQTVTCTIAAPFAINSPVSFVIPITPQAAASGTSVSNTGSVVGGGDPSCPGGANCTSTTITTPVNAPAVRVVKTASSSNFIVGVAASYTLTVTNVGNAATTAVTTVTDNVPTGLTIGTAPSGCAVSGQIVTCTIAAGLATNSPVSFVIPVTPQASISGSSISNSAAVSGGGDPTCPSQANTNCSSTVITPVNAPQLQIVKTASSTNFVVGVAASYTLTVTNTGSVATTAVSTITDIVPSTLTIGTVSSACNVSGQTVTCTIATGLAINTPVSFVIAVTPLPAANATILTNTANVSGGGDPSCPNQANANCSSTVTTPVNAPQLQVVKTASNSSFVVGTPASYTLTITNIGSAVTTAVTTVTDNVPSNLSISVVPGGCAASGQIVTCTIAAGLAINTPVSFVIPVTPLAAANGTSLANTATVSGGGDPTCPSQSNPNCSSTVITPVTQSQLTIVKTGPATATAGQNIVYSITITNTGTAVANNAILSDPAPTGLTYVSVGAPCSALPCNLGTLNVGQSVTVTGLTFAISRGFTGSILNIASVVSDQTTQTSSSASTVVKLPQANPPKAVPVNTPWLLLMLGLILGLGGVKTLRVTRR
ncbi:DUF11 domain-containing protein [Pseudolysobacter antarcticus]|uniref:DUF11 domain-containing protein n=1 Tax=Pseudolysobacter antarcticus TaxID=2511995 RepID=A0A411HH89_9GAMM|nr:DUF11 domain-containing protein [Pseudolysobacter antarcticus]QBB69777.1 DUF11 domain-containing protein [Pseudolysobacter antarcticus]